MGRIIALFMGLAVLSFVYMKVMNRPATVVPGIDGQPSSGASAPKQTLDNVRTRADQLGAGDQKRADDAERKMNEAEH